MLNDVRQLVMIKCFFMTAWFIIYLNRGVKLAITVTIIYIFIIVMYKIKIWKRSLLVMNSDRLITWSCGSSRLHRALIVSVSSLFICLTAASLFWLTHRSLSVTHYLLSTKQTTNTVGSWLKVKHLGAKEANISHNSWWNLKKKELRE